jgi:predicted GNAT family N-acyltransferase
MSSDDKKSAKKEPAAVSRVAEPKTEAVKAEAGKSEAAPSNRGMGEGQKAVSQAYKDNWNAIFAKKKKR